MSIPAPAATIPARADRSLLHARIAIALVYLINGGGLGLWAGHILLVRNGLGLSEGELSLALLGMAGGAMLAMPLMGRLAARFGSGPCTLVAGLGYVAALPLPLAAGSWWQLLLAILVLGAGNGLMDVAMSTQGTHIEQRLGRPVMSSINGFFGLGGMLGAGLASLMLGMGGAPLPRLVVIAGVMALLLAIAGRFLLRDVASPAEQAASSGRPRLPSMAALVLGCLALMSVMAEGATMDWSAIYLADVLGAGADLAALGFAAFCLTLTLARFAGDRVVQRLGPLRVMRASGVIATFGFALVIAAPIPSLAIAGYAVAGLGLANLFPVMISAASRLPGIAPAAGVATVAMFAYSGGLLGPVLIGFGAELAGLRLSLASLVLVTLLVALAGLTRTVRSRLE